MSRQRYGELAAWMAIGVLVVALPMAVARISRPARSAPFDVDRVAAHVDYLAEALGPREAGSDQARRAAAYMASQLRALGYEPETTSVELPDGRRAHNVSALKQGVSPREVVLAAHLDTFKGSPGANDDASGVGAIIELARLLRGTQPPLSVRFLGLGAEEALPGSEAHSFSSAAYLEGLSDEQRNRIAAVLVLDKIGVGRRYLVRYIEGTSPAAAEQLALSARRLGHKPVYTSVRRWDEHMPFEDAGIPTAWVEWSRDPNLHKPTDLPGALSPGKMRAVGDSVFEAITTWSEGY